MAKKTTNKETESPDTVSLLTDYDIHLFKSGKHFKLYEKMGAHIVKQGNKEGTYFAVWAPNARATSVIGNFNQWNNNQHKLSPQVDQSGI